MKYSKIADKIMSVLLAIFEVLGILICLGIFWGCLWFDIKYGIEDGASSIISIVWFPIIPCSLVGIHYLLGLLLGDKWYNSGYVYEGKSVLELVKTPQYYKRRMIFSFIACGLFFLLIFRFILVFKYSIAMAIVGIVCSIIAIVLSYILARGSMEKMGSPK